MARNAFLCFIFARYVCNISPKCGACSIHILMILYVVCWMCDFCSKNGYTLFHCYEYHLDSLPEASVHPQLILLPVTHSLPCHAIVRLTIVQRVSCRVCCQRIQLELTSLSLSFTPTLQSGSSLSRSFSRLNWSTRRRGHLKILGECVHCEASVRELYDALAFHSITFSSTSHNSFIPSCSHLQYLLIELEPRSAWGRG